MYRVDIVADLNDEDDTGYLWTFLDEARNPGQITPGALVVAGDENTAAVCQVRSPADGDWYDEDAAEPGAFLLTGTRRDAQLMRALLERALRSPGLEAFVDEAGWLIPEGLGRYQLCTLPIRFARDEGGEEDEDVRGLRAPSSWRQCATTPPDERRSHGVDEAGSGRSRAIRPTASRSRGGDDLDWLFSRSPLVRTPTTRPR